MNFRDIAMKLVLDNGYRDLCEVGVWRGELSRMLYQHARTLVCVDPWSALWNNFGDYTCTMGEPPKTQEDLNRMHDELQRDLPGALILRMPSEEAAKHVPFKSLDFVFIDAVHLRRNMAIDLGEWCEKIRVPGMLAGDDYCGEVKEAVDEYFDDDVESDGPVWWVRWVKLGSTE